MNIMGVQMVVLRRKKIQMRTKLHYATSFNKDINRVTCRCGIAVRYKFGKGRNWTQKPIDVTCKVCIRKLIDEGLSEK